MDEVRAEKAEEAEEEAEEAKEGVEGPVRKAVEAEDEGEPVDVDVGGLHKQLHNYEASWGQCFGWRYEPSYL